ncbi:MAG: hypothetical protein ACLP50_08330 [Solirubrobacteraceae bacterium]
MAHLVTLVIGAIPDPGQGIAPPGSDKITTLLSWVAWLVTACCVGGVLYAGGKMAAGSLSGGGYGGGGQHATTLGWVLAGCIVAGSAAAIAGAML